jgi:HlyD family secretion protein/macrolide-specific efflux system membrane fusion protein
MRFWPVILGLCTVALGVFGVFVAKGRGGKDPAQAAANDPSLIARVERGDLEISVVELGRIEPREKVGVKSKVAGQVDRLLVDEGDMVKKGQLLLVLDPIDFQRNVVRAEQDVQKAQAAVELAQITLDRRQRGLNDRAVSQADVDLSENDLKTKKIALLQAKESLATAQDQLRFSRIVAPLDGTVTQRTVRVGETVVPGSMATLDSTALLTVSDLTVLIAKADLNQIDVAKVRLGQQVTLTLDALPGKKFRATVSKIAPASVLPKGKEVEVFPVEATLAKEGTEVIKPGMTADVRIHIDTRKDVLRLPIEAIVKEKGKTYVTRVEEGEKGKLRSIKTEVEVGARNDRDQEIVSGVKQGDRVLIKPPSADANEFK